MALVSIVRGFEKGLNEEAVTPFNQDPSHCCCALSTSQAQVHGWKRLDLPITGKVTGSFLFFG
jgi:hypothetical protein